MRSLSPLLTSRLFPAAVYRIGRVLQLGWCFSFLLGLVLGLAAPAWAQPQDVRFVQLSKADGLSVDKVEAILEDHRGFMWFGTPDGLTRYDGHTITIYRTDPRIPTTLSHNAIEALVEDHAGRLWIATLGGGLNRYDRATDTFVRYPYDPGDPAGVSDPVVTSLHIGPSGTLWVGTYNGVDRYDPATDTFTALAVNPEDPSRGLPSPYVHVMLEDPAGRLWVGTAAGLTRYDPRDDTYHHYAADPSDPQRLASGSLWALCEDPDGGLWVGTHGGLHYLDPDTDTFTQYRHDLDDPTSLSNDNVETVLVDRTGGLWVGTDGGGLNRFDREAATFTRYLHQDRDDTSLGSNVVRTIYEDSKGDLWVGNFNGPISFYNTVSNAFSYYRHEPGNPRSLSHSTVSAFHEDEDGSLWVGTDGGGLNRYDPTQRRFIAYQHDPRDPNSLRANAVLAILRDRRGALWAGTWNGGVNRMDEARGTFKAYTNSPDDPTTLTHDNVWDLLEDRQGRLWMATFDGVSRYDYDTDGFVQYPHNPADSNSIGHFLVWSLYEDTAGTLWMATQNGLSRYDEAQDQFTTYRHDDLDPASLSNNQVSVLLEDRQGRFWVGTNGGGLNRFDRTAGTFTAFTHHDGLPSDVILGLLEDASGHLWMSTNEGLSRFNPDTEQFVNYDQSDGLLAGPFTRNAYMKSATGELFFGGTNGFASFHPSEVRDNPHIPPVVLTSFEIFNQPVPIGGDSPLQQHITETQQLTLRHDQSVIRFGFAALNFRAPEKNQYAYRLEPFDAEWATVGTRNTATYTNLDPGTYTFRVRASNNSGVWNEAGVALILKIQPPYWATWWFRLLVGLLVAGLLIAVYEYQIRTFRRHNAALQAEVDERKQAEAEREGLIQELEAKNAELERFTYTVSHDLKSPLVTIKGFLGFIRVGMATGRTEGLAEDVGRIERAADQMGQLLDELLKLSRTGRLVNPSETIALKEVAQEAIILVSGRITARGVDVELAPEMPMVMGDRVRLREVFQNLIDNAVKFMGMQPNPRVEVGAELRNGVVVCFVRDNGKGVQEQYREKIFGLFERLEAKEDGTGIGLALVRRIIEVHGGHTWVASDGLGHGSTFFFTLTPAPEARSETLSERLSPVA